MCGSAFFKKKEIKIKTKHVHTERRDFLFKKRQITSGSAELKCKPGDCHENRELQTNTEMF